MTISNGAFESAARYFSVLAEPARLKILHAICAEEKSVNAIIAATGMAQANASRHLGLMYQAGMVVRRREGTQVFYRVVDSQCVDLCRTVSTQIELRCGQDVPDASFGQPHSVLPSNQKEQASV